ncbi:hypothetical protein APHAL10511_000247 [Amanita phalloides]|nr:hypothetical protein APHAL10511_000247 [Amanita phalloides]
MGKIRDIRNRSKHAHTDRPEVQRLIENAQKAIFDGTSFKNSFFENSIGKSSLTAIHSAFSLRFYKHGLNHYSMYVPDLLHKFELRVWKATFVHLMRILYANGGDLIQELNDRNIPTFGCGTIRCFTSNALGIKKLAVCNYEDLLQCAIPVFEALLPTPHNRIIMDLLFELATWHVLAKLRLHTETTLKGLETSTKRLGDALRTFKKVTCAAYITKELPSEEAAWG